MARAKRTERADARRRYRQALAPGRSAEATDESAEEATDVGFTGTAAASRSPGSRPTAGRSPGGRPAGAPARPSLIGALRGAYHPPLLREDLALLPQLIRGRWFLISLALVVVGGLVFVALPNAITATIFQFVTLPPAMGPIFLVGFMATRASYLLGGIVGVVDVLLYLLLVLFVIPTRSDVKVPTDVGSFAASAILVGLPSGVLFASAAAWYRRFLYLSNPNRGGGPRPGARSDGRARGGRPASKPAPRRSLLGRR